MRYFLLYLVFFLVGCNRKSPPSSLETKLRENGYAIILDGDKISLACEDTGYMVYLDKDLEKEKRVYVSVGNKKHVIQIYSAENNDFKFSLFDQDELKIQPVGGLSFKEEFERLSKK